MGKEEGRKCLCQISAGGMVSFMQDCGKRVLLWNLCPSSQKRITEAGKDFQNLQVQPVTDPRFVNQTRALSARSSQFLNASRGGDSTTSMGIPFQCLTTLSVEKFFLMSNLNHPWYSSRPFPSVLNCLWEEALSQSTHWDGVKPEYWLHKGEKGITYFREEWKRKFL